MALILVVDDEFFIREMAVMILEELGHEVLSAGSVDEALVILRSPRSIDALFTDIYLKAAVFGGCEIARQAVVLRPQFPVLYTTGNATTDELNSKLVPGAHFLRKPYSQHELQDAVEDLLATAA
jgi:CheY-like chemotaxis protein